MYRITLTDNQLSLLEKAVESYFRVRMGQHFDLADDVAFKGYDRSSDSTNDSTEFDERIRRRNDAQDLYDIAYRMAFPAKSVGTEDMRNAIDIWHVIRHQRWLDNPNVDHNSHWNTASDEPFQTGTEPLCKVERIEE